MEIIFIFRVFISFRIPMLQEQSVKRYYYSFFFFFLEIVFRSVANYFSLKYTYKYIKLYIEKLQQEVIKSIVYREIVFIDRYLSPKCSISYIDKTIELSGSFFLDNCCTDVFGGPVLTSFYLYSSALCYWNSIK